MMIGAALWWLWWPNRLSWHIWQNRAKLRCPQCRCHHRSWHIWQNRAKLLLSSMGVTISGTPCPRHHRTIWCRSTFGPRGLSNPTSFLRPALPMAPTTDNNAKRTERPPPEPSFLRDFTLYMTSKELIMKKVSNYITCLTRICGNMWFLHKNNSCE